MARRRKTARQRKIKELTDLWSKVVRERDGCCQKGGPDCKGVLQAHHIMSCRHFNTRFDPQNGIALCKRHHIYWAHREPVEFTMWLIEKIGQRQIDKLRLLSNMTWDKDTLKWEMYLKTQARGNDE